MNPGELRHRITIQKLPDNAQNSYGEENEETVQWDTVKSAWAAVNPISGREYFSAEKLNSEVTHRIKLRFTPGILPGMRVEFKDRHFSILSVINFQERGADMQLMCKELI